MDKDFEMAQDQVSYPVPVVHQQQTTAKKINNP
jgi:hypothetical protein